MPEDVWLEGVVNAVVHRSYSVQGDHVHVDVYDDRIVIESPGRFPGLVDPTKPLDITRFARNPRIARACTDLGELAAALGATRPTVLRHLAGLRDADWVQWTGNSPKDPRASWRRRR